MPKSGRRSNAARAARQVSLRILSWLPITRSTSTMPANSSGWVCAAQPVTTTRAPGRARFSRRIDCRAWATASRVTAQLLTMIVSESPAFSASRRITSDSNALSRQPKVTVSMLMSGDGGKQRRIEATLIFERRGARHQHVVVALAPFDREHTARQRDLNDPVGTLEPGRRHRRGTCRRAAGLGQPRAALPGADRDVVAIDDMGERDVGALGENRVVFQQRPDAGEIVGVDVVDPENRVRIAHADRGWRMQQRRIDRPDLEFDITGIAEFLG